ncbi:MAG: ankyrin repeat protein [Alphaproteobacteria bacterium]|jgi:ankyrin repeat protein|nr:ankyrin repeat protein [Alphaproteobacteria bacterium]
MSAVAKVKSVANRIVCSLSAAIALSLATTSATQAQMFSDGFSFLKAVKERDGEKATSLVSTPGSVVINTKDRSTGNGALHMLARERDLTWLSFLLGKGAKPDLQNNQGDTPLAVATQVGWVDGAEQLIRMGASVDLPNGRGETPLILAVHNRDVPMVRLLLNSGANPTRSDSVAGYSALDYARQDGRSSAVLKLIEAKQAAKATIAGPKL